ncbi:LETM1-like protein-domain-containing protein [Syncephalis fuscata]|nr:LETM1-like protein-domain-containing protein [Syncephalis fuscata]
MAHLQYSLSRVGAYTAPYVRYHAASLPRFYSAMAGSRVAAAPKPTQVSSSPPESTDINGTNNLSIQVKAGQLANAYSFAALTGDAEKTLGEKIKFYARHYLQGLKQVFVNRKEANATRQRIAGGQIMTRADYQMITRASADIRKLLPFIGILIILPESIPLLLIFAPGLVPSTCILPSQMENKNRKVQERRDAMTRAIYESTEKNNLIPAKVYCNSDSLRELAIQYPTEFLLDQLSKEHLAAYCRFLGLSDFGSLYMLQRRFVKHMDYLRLDDELIQRESIESLSEELLRTAAEERGIRSHQVEPAVLRSELQNWIDLRLGKPTIPAGMLVFSRVFRNANIKSSVTPFTEQEVAEKI